MVPAFGPRADGLVNAFTGHGTTRDVLQYTTHVTRAVNDLDGIDLRRGNWLARRICELMPSHCFGKGYTLKLDDKELAEKIMTVAETLGINQKCVDAGAMERATGGAALYPVLEGALDAVATPLNLEQPRIAKLNAIHLLEPRELTPVTWYTDLNHPKFRMPQTYRLMPLSSGRAIGLAQVIIHESRLVIFPGRRVSAEPQPGQRWGWGDNELTPVDEAIKNFGLSWGSAATILKNFSQRILKLKGLAEILKEDGGEAVVQKRAQTMDMMANVLKMMLLDGEDDFVSVTASVGGMAELLVQFAQFVSAAADIPMTRLFGMSPAGMNATGEFDQDGWFDRVGNEQKHKYTAPVEQLLRLIMLSSTGPTGGKEPSSPWSVEWIPLKNQNAKEVAETRKIDAETDQIRIESQVYSADDAAESRYKGDTYGSDITIDWKRREAQKKIDEERAADLDEAAIAAMGRVPGDAAGNARRGFGAPAADPNAQSDKKPPEAQ